MARSGSINFHSPLISALVDSMISWRGLVALPTTRDGSFSFAKSSELTSTPSTPGRPGTLSEQSLSPASLQKVTWISQRCIAPSTLVPCMAGGIRPPVAKAATRTPPW